MENFLSFKSKLIIFQYFIIFPHNPLIAYTFAIIFNKLSIMIWYVISVPIA